MAVTLGPTGITFPDATTQTTAATGGGAAIQATFTAAAAITAGQVVQFTTGTNVTPVTGTVGTQSVAGSNTVLSTGNSSASSNWGAICTAYDPNTAGSFVTVGLNSSSSALTLVAGTTSTNTTTVGSVVTSTLANNTYGIAGLKVMFDPVTAGKGMVVFVDAPGSTSKVIKAIIFTVSGTTLTIQSTTSLITGGANLYSTFSYYGQDRFVYAYCDSGAISVRACSISTYTISQGTDTTISSVALKTTSKHQAMDMDYSKLTTNLLGVSFVQSTNSDVYAILFTVNPTTKVITAGNAVATSVGTFTYCSISFDPLVSTRFAVGACPNNIASGAFAVVGSISGTTISATYSALSISAAGTAMAGIVVKYLGAGDGAAANSVLTYMFSYVSTNCCTTYYYSYFSSGIAASTAYNASYSWLGQNYVYISDDSAITNLTPISLVSGQPTKVALPYARTGTTTGILRFGQATINITNLDSTKIIGIADASASAAASVVVNLWGGIDTHQTGKTPNTTYYVDVTGALTTTSTAPNVSMGKALTATTFLLKTTP